MQDLFKTLMRTAAVAVIGMVMLTAGARDASAQTAGAAPAAAEKKLKDNGEYDIYNEVLKDIGTNNSAKALTDLATWTQKYPDTDFKDDRAYYYLLAYDGTKQYPKVEEIAAGLLAKDLHATFKDWKQVLQVLFKASADIQAIPNASPEALATAQKAAQELVDYNTKPEGLSDTDWTALKGQLQTAGKGTLMWLALSPGETAMTQYRADHDASHCQAAEAAYTKALQTYPDSAQVAYGLGSALVCQQKADINKISQGLYEIARAAAIDPAKGSIDAAQQKGIDTYLGRIYNQYHGADDEGLKQLKTLALNSPTPPANFHIESTTEKAKRQEEEFRKTNPQLALWLGLKGQLADTNGEQYFESSLKTADVKGENGAKALKGTLVEAKPACRSKELIVAISDATHAEVTLKLDKALTGKPETGAVVQWNGVPSAFVKDPFMLTMDVEGAQVEGLKTSPCAAAAPATHKAPVKKKQ